jgi:transposase-like protein
MPERSLDYEPMQSAAEARCPFCRSESVVAGRLHGNDSYAVFQPDGVKSFAWTFVPSGVRVDQSAFICSECGSVWSRTDPAVFRERYERWKKGATG